MAKLRVWVMVWILDSFSSLMSLLSFCSIFIVLFLFRGGLFLGSLVASPIYHIFLFRGMLSLLGVVVLLVL